VTTSPPTGSARQLRRVLFVSGSGASATLRYRVRLPEEALRSRGVDTRAVHYTDPVMAHLADSADVVVLYRVPAGAELIELLADLRRRPRPPLVTYDVDDLVFRPEHLDSMSFLGSFTPADRALFGRAVTLRGDLIGQTDLLTGSTEEVLSELAAGHLAPTALLPNGVGIVGARLADHARRTPRPAGGLRLGYFSGSATHDGDWSTIEPVVLDFLARHRDARLVLVGQVNPSPAALQLRSQLQVLDAVGWRALPALLRTVDVNLAPLERAPFTDAKSAIKWLEAALVETPTVATATGPFAAAVESGRTGLLAGTPQEWASAMDRLADDAGLRAAMGAAARESAMAQFGPSAQADRLVEVLAEGLARLGHSTGGRAQAPPAPPSWQRRPVLLERYPWPDALAGHEIPLPAQVRARDTALRAARLGRRAEAKAVRMAKRAILRMVRHPPSGPNDEVWSDTGKALPTTERPDPD
jgi:glycosyltransferase involved in cell wall biosynthesis